LAFVDRNALLLEVEGIPVYPPGKLAELEFDELIIASYTHKDEIISGAKSLGTPL
jgi:hypothetical protein